MTRISFIRSALCATRGLFRGISSERNIKIQMIIGALLISTAIILSISKVYLITMIIVFFLVIILELFNRGFEKLIDLVSPEYNKEFGKVKDTMAGVVLLTFTMAFIVSFLVLYEPVINLLKIMYRNFYSVAFIILDILFLLIVILVDYKKRN